MNLRPHNMSEFVARALTSDQVRALVWLRRCCALLALTSAGHIVASALAGRWVAIPLPALVALGLLSVYMQLRAAHSSQHRGLLQLTGAVRLLSMLVLLRSVVTSLVVFGTLLYVVVMVAFIKFLIKAVLG